MPIKTSLWLPISHKSMAPCRVSLRNPLGQLQSGLGNVMVRFHIPFRVTLYCFWTPATWCCQRFIVRSREVARVEATSVC